ncbi:LacI family transcriptional regulator [Chitinophaga alhagiae]|uniref:LacI family transcriptional regulator n=1 Tax=Chitinophaga alhagiae TaxID=2203219 RepID=A0ABN5LWE8_9BACT|nr:LacI family DNA-binding transcriptional regulator [Chitinophaga alhagiae]AWO02110.1 LacI family transcriptional regulator [Chitinophaga alhagiae]
MRKHYATIKDIANALNISFATVSRALRDAYDVKAETRELVLAKAAELNYRPNVNAKGLAQHRSYNLGVVLPGITNYYFSTVITGIQEVAYNSGYNLILYVTNDSAERERDMIRNLALSSLDGLLVCVSSDSDDGSGFQAMIDEGIPVVFFDRVAEQVNTSRVVQDDYNGAFEATEHLVQNGYRKIAHIAGPEGLAFTRARLKGYKDALKKHGLPLKQEWIIYSGFSQAHGEQDALNLWKCRSRPDAIFAVNDRKAVGAMLALKKLGVEVGKTVGVVGFTNDPVASIISPSLTTIAEPAFEIGKISCQLLLNHIKKKRFDPKEVVLPGKLIVRESSLKV